MEFIITIIKVAKSILFHCNTFLYYLQYLNEMISRDEYSSALTLNKNMGVVGNLAKDFYFSFKGSIGKGHIMRI